MTLSAKNVNDVVLRTIGTEEDIRATFNLMKNLRPHLVEVEAYVVQIIRQIQSGYILLAAYQKERPVGLAGYRFSESTLRGHFVYVDDLVVAPEARGMKIGETLLKNVSTAGANNDCSYLVLDTSHDNKLGQKFYAKIGMETVGLHYAQPIHKAL